MWRSDTNDDEEFRALADEHDCELWDVRNGVMLGCMIESNASIAAACHLAPLLDYTDLDGSLLLADDPSAGVSISAGDIDLAGTDRPGIGAHEVT